MVPKERRQAVQQDAGSDTLTLAKNQETILKKAGDEHGCGASLEPVEI